MHSRLIVLVSILSVLVGCTSSHAIPDPELTPVTPPQIETHLAPVHDLDTCFTGGGALFEVGSVSNNDRADHGALVTFGVSPGGLVAAAGADGTLKFWTLDATFVGEADPRALTYGPEVAGAPITDLAVTEDAAVAGDVRGLVQRLTPTGAGGVLGGTMPDVPIASVAFDRTAQRLAHAQGGAAAPDVTPLVVNTLDGTMRANLTDTPSTITDLAFTADGSLVVAGNDGTHAVLEVRDGSDPTIVRARPDIGRDASVVEVAAAHEGPMIVALTTHALYAIDGTNVTLLVASDTAMRSVDLTPSGDYALIVDANGAVSARSTIDGHEAGHASIASAIGVRLDAAGQRVVVGGSDAVLHVLSCR